MSRDFTKNFGIFCIQLLLFTVFLSIDPKTASAVTYDLATTTTWNVRWDGASADDQLSLIAVHMADLNGNGVKDLIAVAPATDYNSRSNSGSVYVIYDNLFSSLTGTGNTVDLATASKWNIRYDMAFAGDLGTSNGMGVVRTADIDLDDKQDLIIGARADHGATDTGSVYIIYNTLIDDYTGTGNSVDLATTSNFNVRIDGGTASDFLGFFTTYAQLSQPQDVNGDSKADIIVGAIGADYNGALSGSIYILYNALVNLAGTGNTLGMGTTSNFSIRIDGSAASELLGGGEVIVADINNDSAKDLVIGAPAADKNTTDTGSIYILFNAIFGSLTGTGNTFNLGTSTNYNIRIDSTNASTKITQMGNLKVADVDNDGKNDVIAGSFAYNSSSGNIRFFLNTLLDDYTGTGNTFNYTTHNLSILSNNDGGGEGLTFQGFVLGDYFSTGKLDLIVPAYKADFNSRSDSGSGYIISNSILNNNLGASDGSSSIALSSSSNYSSRYDGAVADDRIVLDAESLFDANNDGSLDLFFGSYVADNNSRASSGSLYLIYNFPHTVSVTQPTTPTTLTSFDVAGTITATNSTTTISGVQYQLDSNSLTGTWTACTSDDGTFDETTEAYTCSLSGMSAAAHTLYVRAYDSNTSYTAQSNLGSTTFTITAAASASTSTTVEVANSSSPAPSAQIGQSEGGNIGGVFRAINEGSPSCQNALVIMPSRIFNFDSFLSSHRVSPTTFALGRGGLMRLTLRGRTYWQVGSLCEIWYKAYAPGYKTDKAARIIPELQQKPSIIVLSYTHTDLIPPGRPLSSFSAPSLKLAHSFDGIIWRILPTSVVDTKNKSVGAIHRVGGYYMIVGSGSSAPFLTLSNQGVRGASTQVTPQPDSVKQDTSYREMVKATPPEAAPITEPEVSTRDKSSSTMLQNITNRIRSFLPF